MEYLFAEPEESFTPEGIQQRVDLIFWIISQLGDPKLDLSIKFLCIRNLINDFSRYFNGLDRLKSSGKVSARTLESIRFYIYNSMVDFASAIVELRSIIYLDTSNTSANRDYMISHLNGLLEEYKVLLVRCDNN